jgi:hypothetical protein
MEPITSILLLALLVIVAFVLARFVFRLALRAVGCILTVIIALGILYILIQFVF